MDQEDATLLEQYARNRSEPAFAALVQRYVNLVFSTALRRAGDRGLAEEVSQKVFLLLARKAGRLNGKVLAGWLYRATCNIAADALKSERRRRAREEKAIEMLHQPESSNGWARIAPILEEGMSALNDKERNALLLRFFQNKPLREVGRELGISEDAAQKRIARSLDKLRAWLGRRGVPVSPAGLGGILSASAVHTAPEGLAAAISISTAAAGTAAGVSIFSLNNLGGLMSLENLKTGIGAVAALLATGVVIYQHQEIGSLKQENTGLQTLLVEPSPQVEGATFDPEYLERLKRDAAEVHRLRSQVTLLRQDQLNAERLQAELDRMRDWIRDQPEQPPLTPEEEVIMDTGIMKLNLAKSLALALILTADEKEGLFPANWEEAIPHLNKAFHGAELAKEDPALADPISLQHDWEIVYSGPVNELIRPQETILIRETNPWYHGERGVWLRTYGFADGHSEIVSRADGDFEAWEEERSLRAFHLPHQSPPH